MLTRHGYATGMNDVDFDPLASKDPGCSSLTTTQLGPPSFAMAMTKGSALLIPFNGFAGLWCVAINCFTCAKSGRSSCSFQPAPERLSRLGTRIEMNVVGCQAMGKKPSRHPRREIAMKRGVIPRRRPLL